MNRKLKIRNEIAKRHLEHIIKTSHELYRIGRVKDAIKMGKIARSFVKNFGIRFKREQKFFYCKSCKNLLYPNINMRVRVRNNRFKHITITCLLCGSVKRIRLVNSNKKM